MAVTLILPFPPSVNGYWRQTPAGYYGGRRQPAMTRISARGRAYRAAVVNACAGQGVAGLQLTGPLAIEWVMQAPTRATRDVDNYAKAMLDALVHAGVLADDKHIDDLRVVRGPVIPKGRALLRITRGQPEIPEWAQPLVEAA